MNETSCSATSALAPSDVADESKGNSEPLSQYPRRFSGLSNFLHLLFAQFRIVCRCSDLPAPPVKGLLYIFFRRPPAQMSRIYAWRVVAAMTGMRPSKWRGAMRAAADRAVGSRHVVSNVPNNPISVAISVIWPNNAFVCFSTNRLFDQRNCRRTGNEFPFWNICEVQVAKPATANLLAAFRNRTYSGISHSGLHNRLLGQMQEAGSIASCVAPESTPFGSWVQ